MPHSDDYSGKKTVLILGGTTEARALADLINKDYPERVKTIYSLAGRTRPRRVAGEVRIGGFGGKQGLSDYIKINHIDFVIDSTHPFAEKITKTAKSVCDDLHLPRLIVSRPPWTQPDGANWHRVSSLEEAAKILPTLSRFPLLTTGRGSLEKFSGLDGLHFYVRVLDKSDKPLPLKKATEIVARPPFDLESEKKVLTEYKIDCLVSKNAGGEQTRQKIVAAMDLSLPVVMVDRPIEPEGPRVYTPEEAVLWLKERI